MQFRLPRINLESVGFVNPPTLIPLMTSAAIFYCSGTSNRQSLRAFIGRWYALTTRHSHAVQGCSMIRHIAHNICNAQCFVLFHPVFARRQDVTFVELRRADPPQHRFPPTFSWAGVTLSSVLSNARRHGFR